MFCEPWIKCRKRSIYSRIRFNPYLWKEASVFIYFYLIPNCFTVNTTHFYFSLPDIKSLSFQSVKQLIIFAILKTTVTTDHSCSKLLSELPQKPRKRSYSDKQMYFHAAFMQIKYIFEILCLAVKLATHQDLWICPKSIILIVHSMHYIAIITAFLAFNIYILN